MFNLHLFICLSARSRFLHCWKFEPFFSRHPAGTKRHTIPGKRTNSSLLQSSPFLPIFGFIFGTSLDARFLFNIDVKITTLLKSENNSAKYPCNDRKYFIRIKCRYICSNCQSVTYFLIEIIKMAQLLTTFFTVKSRK